MKNFSLDPFVPSPITQTYAAENRCHQGIPGIEILAAGRLFATWYAGTLAGEGPGNYVVLSTSSDRGMSWKEIQVIAPESGREKNERAFDATLWLAPDNRLWWFWSQCTTSGLSDIFDGRSGVWAVRCDDPDTDHPVWSEPRRIAEGVMMNKPTVLSDGAWALPTALWALYPKKILPEYAAISRSNLSITRDAGNSFQLIVGPDVPDRCFDEHVLIEQQDGTWRVLVRTHYGIGQGFSDDGGKQWHGIGDSGLGGPNSRFAIRRLNSGRLLLINHQVPTTLPGEPKGSWRCREKLTAWLSDDDGKSWYGRLMLDERAGVSYPDLTEGADGAIYCIYDRERVNRGEILSARFYEADVAAGTFVTPGSFMRGLISAFPVKKA